MEKVNLQEKFASFADQWSPKIAGAVNDCLVKLVKLQGEFVWHHHDHEDELFLVVKGALRMQVREPGREREILIREGEFLVVPRGVDLQSFDAQRVSGQRVAELAAAWFSRY